jgi:DNA-binding response OmpR family regulator
LNVRTGACGARFAELAMKVLIVEDNRTLATLMAATLRKAGLPVDVVGTALEAEQALEASVYDALLLDLGLPDRDGLQLMEKLRSSGNAIPILVTTARHALHDRVHGLRAGADDYLVKPFAQEELVARLQALLRRPGKLLGNVLRAGNVELDAETHHVTIDGRFQPIMMRQAVVLELLIRQEGGVVKREYIEDQLFGLDGEHTPNAIEVYVHRLRKNLGEMGATVSIHTIRGVGYMLKQVPTQA